MINIDQYAYMSNLKHVNPLKKFVFSILTLLVCLWADYVPVSVLVLLIMGGCTVYIGGTPFNLFFKMMMIPISFLFIGVLTVAINVSLNSNTFLLCIPAFGMYIGVTQSSIQVAVHLFFKALGAVSCLYYLSLSTPMVDLFTVLRKLKAPKLLVELMGLIYRFIFVLLEITNTMFTAQSSRLGYSNLSSSYRSLAALASTLFIRAMKRADELYTALEARGYDGELNVLEEPFETHWVEYIPLVAINLLLILLVRILKPYTGG